MNEISLRDVPLPSEVPPVAPPPIAYGPGMAIPREMASRVEAGTRMPPPSGSVFELSGVQARAIQAKIRHEQVQLVTPDADQIDRLASTDRTADTSMVTTDGTRDQEPLIQLPSGFDVVGPLQPPSAATAPERERLSVHPLLRPANIGPDFSRSDATMNDAQMTQGAPALSLSQPVQGGSLPQLASLDSTAAPVQRQPEVAAVSATPGVGSGNRTGMRVQRMELDANSEVGALPVPQLPSGSVAVGPLQPPPSAAAAPAFSQPAIIPPEFSVAGWTFTSTAADGRVQHVVVSDDGTQQITLSGVPAVSASSAISRYSTQSPGIATAQTTEISASVQGDEPSLSKRLRIRIEKLMEGQLPRQPQVNVPELEGVARVLGTLDLGESHPELSGSILVVKVAQAGQLALEVRCPTADIANWVRENLEPARRGILSRRGVSVEVSIEDEHGLSDDGSDDGTGNQLGE